MLPEFSSNRILFEPLAPKHFEAFADMGSDIRTVLYINGKVLPREERIAELERHLRETCKVPGLGLSAMYLKSDKSFIGRCNLSIIRDREDEVHIGYRLKPEVWGKGFATEACKRLMTYGFEELNLETIYGITHPDNWASQRVLLKSGMKFLNYQDAYGSKQKFFSVTNTSLP